MFLEALRHLFSRRVEILELEQMLILLLGILLGFLEQALCAIREGAKQGVVTHFVHNEVAVALARLLAVKGEGVLAVRSQARVEAELCQ